MASSSQAGQSSGSSSRAHHGIMHYLFGDYYAGNPPEDPDVPRPNRVRGIKFLDESGNDVTENVINHPPLSVRIKGELRYRSIPIFKHLKRPSPTQINSIRNGARHGFLTGAKVWPASWFDGVDLNAPAIPVDDGDAKYWYYTDHLEEEGQDEWLTTNGVMKEEDGSNLYFVIDDMGRDIALPVYHFWIKDGDRDPTHDFNFGKELDAEIARQKAAKQNSSTSGSPKSSQKARYPYANLVEDETSAEEALVVEESSEDEGVGVEESVTEYEEEGEGELEPFKGGIAEDFPPEDVSEVDSADELDNSLYIAPPLKPTNVPAISRHVTYGLERIAIPRWHRDSSNYDLFPWQLEDEKFQERYVHYQKVLCEEGGFIQALNEIKRFNSRAWKRLTLGMRAGDSDKYFPPFNSKSVSTQLGSNLVVTGYDRSPDEFKIHQEVLCSTAERLANVHCRTEEWWRPLRPDTWWFFQLHPTDTTDSKALIPPQVSPGRPSKLFDNGSRSSPHDPRLPSNKLLERERSARDNTVIEPDVPELPSGHALAFLNDYSTVFDEENEVMESYRYEHLNDLPLPSTPRPLPPSGTGPTGLGIGFSTTPGPASTQNKKRKHGEDVSRISSAPDANTSPPASKRSKRQEDSPSIPAPSSARKNLAEKKKSSSTSATHKSPSGGSASRPLVMAEYGMRQRSASIPARETRSSTPSPPPDSPVNAPPTSKRSSPPSISSLKTKTTGKSPAGKTKVGKETAGKKTAGKKTVGKKTVGKKTTTKKEPASKIPDRKGRPKRAAAIKAEEIVHAALKSVED
ncbi:hypothetical protein NA57DRAFT_71710 [Rhizodiscina lignyota]|uniref:Uncharacterized protein n=1 Tax=Rhizodiscina lignyota TaxID=1504668 RepID=A0A9P4IML5_9PEZI|nr:hypothetical protein NA57DRAFT_71710 [Rhizodiscina lignyota]